MLVEFVVIAALVALALVGLVVLAVAGVAENGIAGAFEHVVSAGLGALTALAYAARGVINRPKQ